MHVAAPVRVLILSHTHVILMKYAYCILRPFRLHLQTDDAFCFALVPNTNAPIPAQARYRYLADLKIDSQYRLKAELRRYKTAIIQPLFSFKFYVPEFGFIY